MWIPPLLIVPLILYNVVAFGLFGGDSLAWSNPVAALTMVSGASWSLTLGDLLIVLALILLFFEVLKSTMTGHLSVIDHMLSTFVFIVYLVEFLVVPAATTSLFFICMAMSLIDLIAGFTVSIRAAGRDVNFQ